MGTADSKNVRRLDMEGYTLISGFTVLALALCLSVCLHCQSSPTMAGSVTEGGNTDVEKATVSGTIVDRNGREIAWADIFLRPAEYLPDTTGSLADTAGMLRYRKFDRTSKQDGGFRIDSVLPGEYVLSVFYGDSLGAMKTVRVNSGKNPLSEPLMVSSMGSVRGSVVFPDSFHSVVYIRFYGLENVYRINPSGNMKAFAIDRVPQGNWTIDVLPQQARKYGNKRMDNITVRAGQNTLLDTITFSTFENEQYTKWPCSSVVYCNTTRDGVYIEQNLYSIPVLITLDSSTFDFSRTRKNGEDLRFAGSAGQHLFYEIEHFDAAAGRASLWVLVDTLWADSMTPITMYWGKQDAVSHSLGNQVFSAANDFCAVYHLSEKGDVFRDAVSDGYRGRGKLFDGSEAVAGVGGGADSLDGRNDQITIESLSCTPLTEMTLSMWVKTARKQGSVYLLSKGLNDPVDVLNSYSIRLEDSSDITLQISADGREFTVAGQYPAVNEWVHIAGVYENGALQLYINGLPVAQTAATGSIDQSTLPLIVGYCLEGPQRHFNGVVDEIRIEQVGRSDDWLRLCYENQAKTEAFLLFE